MKKRPAGAGREIGKIGGSKPPMKEAHTRGMDRVKRLEEELSLGAEDGVFDAFAMGRCP